LLLGLLAKHGSSCTSSALRDARLRVAARPGDRVHPVRSTPRHRGKHYASGTERGAAREWPRQRQCHSVPPGVLGGHTEARMRPDRERERRTQRCRQGAPLCRQQAQTSEDPTRPGQHLHRAAAQRPGDPHPAPSTPSTARSPRRRALEPLEVWENEAPLRHWG
ncbi:unnamed protein product, partial [Prorocentrum cordatum]